MFFNDSLAYQKCLKKTSYCLTINHLKFYQQIYVMSLLVLWMKVLPVKFLLQLKIEVFDLSASVLPEGFQPPSQVSTGGGGYEG